MKGRYAIISLIKTTLLLALLFETLNVSPVQAQGTQSSSSRAWTENPADIMTTDRLAGWRRAGLEGYTDKNSVTQGQNITFYVSVRDDLLPSTYTVEIYRVGATDVYKTTVPGGPFTAAFHPLHDKLGTDIFPGDTTKYAVEHRTGCNWPASFSLAIPSNWPSGFYYAKLISSISPYIGAIPFVVKEDQPGSTSNMLVVIAWNTYVAYNFWGGGSLYWWTAKIDPALAYIDTVSFRRPFGYHLHDCGVQSDSLGQFNQRERQFINWAESNNYTLEYCIDLDVEQDDPNGLPLLSKYKAILFPGHSEYWSRQMRLNISDELGNEQTTTFMKLGGNVAFFAANNCYWRIFYNTNSNGLRMNCDKYTLGSLWRRQQSPDPGPEAQFLAVQFHGTNYPGPNSPNIVKNQNHWIFQGTNLVNGQAFGLGNPSHGIDEVAAGEVDQTRANISPSNREVLAKVFIRKLDDPTETHYGEVDSIFSEMAYWEDTNTNARVFSAAGLGWCSALYGTDGNKLGTMTNNILEHFSFEKYCGNIYRNLTWGDDEAATILDGDTYVLASKILTLSNNFTLTINSGVTLYVQGTLVIGSGVTITGGGKIVTSGGGKIHVTNSSEATAFNNSRKLVRDGTGNYHLVFESDGEICYEKLTGAGALSEFRRLSSGNGSNKYPSIAERSGSLFVVWQRYTGSTHVVYHRRYASGAWGTTQTLDSNAGSNAPLPVIASPAANELMVVYRCGGNLKWRRSTDNGSSWSTAATISGTALNSPTVAPAKTAWGENTTALAYATNVIPNASNILLHYYYNGWSSAWNLSSGLPGNLSQHANPSVAASGDLSYWHPHTAWDAYDSQYSGRVILHKVGWNASSYYEFHYQTEDRPSITGLAGATAEMIFRRGEDRFFTGHYNGSWWDVPIATQPGKHPSFSLGSTQAKYVFMSGSAAPFEVKVSSATFSKANLLAEHVKQRAVGLVDPVSGAWLNMRVESFLVKHADGSFSAANFAPALADTARLTASEAWAALASAEFILPAETESLLVVYSIAGEKAKNLSDGQSPLTLTFKVETIGEAALTKASQILALSSDEAFNQAGVLMGVSSEGLRKDAKVILRVYPSHQKSETEVVASVGHVYDLSKGAESASLKPLAARTAQVPASLVLEQNFPNPFNPETEIRYTLPAAGSVRLALYDLTGRLVMMLFEGEQRAGRHTIRWHGQDGHGRPVGAGVYFCRLETPGVVQTRKLVLAK